MTIPEDANPEINAKTGRSPWRNGFEQVQSAAKGLAQSLVSGKQWLSQWFQVSDAELQRLLEQVRQNLPTTEVLLVGKAQTGKSSVIRALTGASADMIGQGFRPHTRHTQRYGYPTEDLPLLNFIDTVGLGEALQDPQAVTAELNGILSSGSSDGLQAAQILLVTVKITDFATDSLHRLLQDLRRTHPQVPCLLAITCLHDLYPGSAVDHPSYPPHYPDVERAAAAIWSQFQDVCDRHILVDFTLEEDGFSPLYYGLEPFAEELAGLLPHAEAQVLHQLLDQAEVGTQIGTIYREAGRRYIAPFAIMAATLAAVPLPFATMPVLTALQVSLVTLLGRLYGQTLSPSQAGGVASAIAGGFLAQTIGRELVKFIPGFGSVVAASWAGAYTWALGEGACVYFGDLLGGKTPDPKQIQKTMQTAFKGAQDRFKASLPGQKPPGK
ncbi:MAG: GTPase [Thermosynechococcaceae cyanobacterium]